MAKLKCAKHDRRVMILEGSGKWVHRTGDLTDCDSLCAFIGEQTVRRGTMLMSKIDLARKQVRLHETETILRRSFPLFGSRREVSPSMRSSRRTEL